MTRIKSIKDLDVSGKQVLVRAGFDVPVKDGIVEDDFRIRSTLETISYLLNKNARIVIISHQGRPKGWDEKFTLEPVARALAELLGRKFLIVGPEETRLPEYDIPHLYFFKANLEKSDLSSLTSQMRDRDIAVLENLRFYPGEEGADEAFAKKLASLGQAYVNESFSNSHRGHASMVLVPRLLPAAGGLWLEKEVSVLSQVMNHPKKPVVVMMGGVKLADKADALVNLAGVADFILLGGGLANLILKIRGFEIGKSTYVEKNEELIGKRLWRDYRDKIKLPLDVVVSTSRDGEPECVKIDKVKPNHMILDIGPQTIREYSDYLRRGMTFIWSGPLGYIENRTYSHGTYALARFFASRTKSSVFGVAGGGETMEVISNLKLAPYIDHVSTGGGAMIEFLAGKKLPGVEVLYG